MGNGNLNHGGEGRREGALQTSAASRLFHVFLAIVLCLGLMPSLALGATEDSSDEESSTSCCSTDSSCCDSDGTSDTSTSTDSCCDSSTTSSTDATSSDGNATTTSVTVASDDDSDDDSESEYRHGTISITCDSADEDNVIYLEVGETAEIVVTPYTHLQYYGCLKYGCPDLCEEQHADDPYSTGCYIWGFGCKCDGNKVARSVDLTTTIVNKKVVKASDVVVDSTYTNADNTNFSDLTRPVTKNGTVTITGRSAGTTTITVTAETDEDGYTLALNHDSTLITLWHPAEVTYTVVVTGEGSLDDEDDYVTPDILDMDENGNYLIDSESDLEAFADIVNGYTDTNGVEVEADPDACALITDDFELESGELPAIGTDSSTGFSGTLDGDGHTISGITSFSGSDYYNGLVVFLDGGSVTDLTLEGTATDISTATGAFVCYMRSGSIENCTNNVDMSGSSRFGGIVLYISGSSSDDKSVISGCTNNGDLVSTYQYAGVDTTNASVGGIAACVNRGTVTITECLNTGSITASTKVGGIVGTAYGNKASYLNLTIKYCANKGDITLNIANSAAAGIIGATAKYDTVAITNCYNTGDVTISSSVTTNTATYAGGILGYSGYGSSAAYVTIAGSYNSGTVAYGDGESSAPSTYCIGSLVGGTTSSTYRPMLSTDYWLTGTADAAEGGSYTGRSSINPTEVSASKLSTLENTLNTYYDSIWKHGTVSGSPILYWEEDEVCETHTYVASWNFDSEYNYEVADLVLECSVCGDTVEVGVMCSYTETEATCTTDAYTTYYGEFTYEGLTYSATYVDTDEGTATGHTWENSGWTWDSDYTSATLSLTCTTCGETVDVEADVSTEVVDAATCESAGSAVRTATVTYDGVEYSDSQDVVLAAMGHAWAVSDWTWDSDYSAATLTLVCENDSSHTVEVSGDDVAVSSVTVDATCEAAGSVTYTATATYEDVEYTDAVVVELEALGHVWEVSEWTWADDYSSATLTLVCSTDAATVDVEADVESVTVEATCETAGSATYTATATYEDVEYTDVAVVELEALGHSWTVVGWAWSSDYSSATLTLACSTDGATVDAAALVEVLRGTSSVTYSATATYDDTAYAAAVEVAYAATRIGGTGRYATAALEALEAYGETGADTVILATGEDFPDSLAATSLAGALDAPILLTKTAYLSDEAAAAISALGASNVIVIGGEGAVSAAVVSALEASGLSVERVYGSNRYATAEAIYTYGLTAASDGGSVWGGTVIVASGVNYADALSASSLAYAQSFPILLAGKTGGLTDASKAILSGGGIDSAVIVGGTSVVSAAAQTYANGILGRGSVERLYGSNRYLTSVALANWTVEQGYLTWDGATFASGDNYPDALAGSALAGSEGSVLLLVNDKNAGTIADALADVADQVCSIYVLGGEGAVSASVLDTMVEALGWEGYDYEVVDTLE